MALSAVIFDRDGTLIDFDATWGPVFANMLYGLTDGDEIAADKAAKASGFDLKNKVFLTGSPIKVQTPKDYSVIWAAALDEEFTDAFVARVEELLLQNAGIAVTPFKDTLKVIHVLSEMGVPIGLATNGTEASARMQLEALGVLQYFDFVAGYDSGYGAKPEAGQLLAFAKAFGLQPEDIAMVGDSLHDIHAANAAGMVGIGLTTGAMTAEQLEADSDYVYDALEGILPHFTAKNA
ncbi:HAD family hydrolase [Rhodobacteraceae bacterium RKSG542]|uniref:HAD family hydrolase n=1 Tax=Pseudovibrio flavus TaxID=2529854 RepID=UPI0012BC6C74|nr:HAD family hydrolase [Pseudovibrio flavus]MTI18749.1 HAD family hydrolase [Pseudovibrio flavus]